MINIVLVDDHIMLRNGLAELLERKGFNILFEASNGKEFIEKLNKKQLPNVVLMDINMPLMNGFETTTWIAKNFPIINVLALSMYDTEINIIRMLRCGAKGYLLKDGNPTELVNAINTVVEKGFYTSDLVNSKMIKSISGSNILNVSKSLNLTEREIVFLKHCCTELSYKEIASEMCISQRTVDGYREELFEKLDIHTRIGLILYAVKVGLITL